MDVLECVTGFCFDNVLIYGRNVLREGCGGWCAGVLFKNSQKMKKKNIYIIKWFGKFNLQPWSQGLEKKSFYSHFAPPHPCAMLTKHFHLTQVCILPFSNFGRGNGGVDTYSVGITIMISCFWHFPTQFVHDCRLKQFNLG